MFAGPPSADQTSTESPSINSTSETANAVVLPSNESTAPTGITSSAEPEEGQNYGLALGDATDTIFEIPPGSAVDFSGWVVDDSQSTDQHQQWGNPTDQSAHAGQALQDGSVPGQHSVPEASSATPASGYSGNFASSTTNKYSWQRHGALASDQDGVCSTETAVPYDPAAVATVPAGGVMENPASEYSAWEQEGGSTDVSGQQQNWNEYPQEQQFQEQSWGGVPGAGNAAWDASVQEYVQPYSADAYSGYGNVQQSEQPQQWQGYDAAAGQVCSSSLTCKVA